MCTFLIENIKIFPSLWKNKIKWNKNIQIKLLKGIKGSKIIAFQIKCLRNKMRNEKDEVKS